MKNAILITPALLLLTLATSGPALAQDQIPTPGYSAPDSGKLTITHLANEGFLISDGSRKVLIDSLVADGIPPYRALTDEQRDGLEQETPPFDGIDVVLATHHHADHFDAPTVVRFLRTNPESRLITTPQAADHVARELDGDDESIAAQVQRSLPAEGRRESFTYDGITITTLNLHHGRRRSPIVENLGFLIEIGGVTVLHVGDTVASPTEIAVNDLDLSTIDVALLPYWMLTGDRWTSTLDELSTAQLILAMHVPGEDATADYFQPAKDIDELRTLIRKRFTNASMPMPGDSLQVAMPRDASDPEQEHE